MRRSIVSLVSALFVAGSALGGAAEAQPVPVCPLRFDTVTNGLPATCLFVGPFNQACGENAAGVFAGDGDIVVVGIAVSRTSPVTFFSGEVRSGTRGLITLWQRDPDLAYVQPVHGSVTLEDGQTLRLRLSEPPFLVDGCPFEEFVGHFVEMVDVANGLDRTSAPRRAAAPPPADPPS